MKLTAKVKLLLTPEQKLLVDHVLSEYVRAVNTILIEMIDYDQHKRFTSKMVEADMPSCLKNQAACDALSIDKKMLKHHMKQPVLKKPCAIWNNQNFSVAQDSISFPVFRNGKSRKICVKAIIPEEMFSLFQQSNLGSLRITKKRGNYIAQIAYTAAETINENSGIMGIDLGLKCPAVSFSNGKVKFFGNGRQNKVIRRHYYTKRKKLQKQKKLNAVKKLGNKEQRIMQDIDHKLSREIVNYAYNNGIKTIKMEALENVRKDICSTTSKSCKNNKKKRSSNRYKFSWSFCRLKQYITYKAALLDIEVIEVNPAYTSQHCPNCGKNNHSHDRNYTCACGYHQHRDVVGAINIYSAEPAEEKSA